MNKMASLLDITPTVLDWFQIRYPHYKMFNHAGKVILTGKSLLPNKATRDKDQQHMVFGSHNLHEVTMYYPMRMARTETYKLIHNLNFKMAFMIDQDFYVSPTFRDLLNRTINHDATHWFKDLQNYYYRPQWELYNVRKDWTEVHNLADDGNYADILNFLKQQLLKWQNETSDPWICGVSAVLENTGAYKSNPTCLPLYNGL